MQPTYKMYILLSYIFLIFSYNNLHCPTFAEAEHPANGFSFDLIHRYSSRSPFYNSSMTLQDCSQLLAHHSSSRYRHLKWLQSKISNNYDTHIIQNNGDYLMKVSIGVPPVDLFVTADTGSDLIWVQCKPCNHCYPQRAPLFDPKKSSTFKTVPCKSPICLNIPETQCNYSTDECQYWYSYGDGSTMTSGIMARDVFEFFNSSILFGCGFTQQGEDYDENEAGIVGLSGGPLSLISQLGSAIDNRFSYCLTPSTSNFTGKLRLGSHIQAKQEAVMVTVPLLSDYFPDFYAVTLKAISVGQGRVEVERDIVIDNGSTLIYVDAGVYTRLEEAVKEAISVMPIPNPPEPDLKLCYDVKPGFRAPDNIVIHLSEGDIVLSSTNFMIDSGDFVCLGIVPLEKDDDEIMILGNIAQVNFEVEFNLDTKMVSFTPASCELGDNS